MWTAETVHLLVHCICAIYNIIPHVQVLVFIDIVGPSINHVLLIQIIARL